MTTLLEPPDVRPRGGRRIIPWRIERKPDPERIGLYRISAVIIGFVLAILIAPAFASSGAGAFYGAVWKGTFGTALGWGNFLTILISLSLASLAAAIPYRLGWWNVGIDGQILMGAWGAMAVAVLFKDLPGPLIIPLMFIAGLVLGTLWIAVPTWARMSFGVSEVITTFLLNFVAVAWIVYWATGPWREKNSAGGIKSIKLPPQSWIGDMTISGVVINWAIFIAVGLPFIFWAASRYTRRGFETTMVGANPGAGRFAGMHTKRLYISAMLMGGAIAGLAGAITMMGTTHQLNPGLTNNTGFNGLVVAVLAGGNEIGSLALSVVYALLLAAGGALSVVGVNSDLVFAIIGFTLIFGSFGEAYARLRLVRTRPANKVAIDSPGDVAGDSEQMPDEPPMQGGVL